MKPRIEIDKFAIRFIDSDGQRNIFFGDLFRKPQEHWHYNLMDEIQKAYETCVKEGIGGQT